MRRWGTLGEGGREKEEDEEGKRILTRMGMRRTRRMRMWSIMMRTKMKGSHRWCAHYLHPKGFKVLMPCWHGITTVIGSSNLK